MRELWFIVGILSLILGAIGIVLPILPTTPFFLVTTYSFTKSSPKFRNWLLSKPIFQKYQSNMTMTRTKKWILLLTVDALLIGYFVVFPQMIVRIIIIVTITIKHFVFYKYVTIHK